MPFDKMKSKKDYSVMSQFIPKQEKFLPSFNNKMKDLEKINKLIEILEESGVGYIIESQLKKIKSHQEEKVMIRMICLPQ